MRECVFIQIRYHLRANNIRFEINNLLLPVTNISACFPSTYCPSVGGPSEFGCVSNSPVAGLKERN